MSRRTNSIIYLAFAQVDWPNVNVPRCCTEWTDRTNWLDVDEHVSHCNWMGVTCDSSTNLVTKLNLWNNGLSRILTKSIGNLTSIEVLDLSGNDIKVTYMLDSLSHHMHLPHLHLADYHFTTIPLLALHTIKLNYRGRFQQRLACLFTAF